MRDGERGTVSAILIAVWVAWSSLAINLWKKVMLIKVDIELCVVAVCIRFFFYGIWLSTVFHRGYASLMVFRGYIEVERGT